MGTTLTEKEGKRVQIVGWKVMIVSELRRGLNHVQTPGKTNVVFQGMTLESVFCYNIISLLTVCNSCHDHIAMT